MSEHSEVDALGTGEGCSQRLIPKKDTKEQDLAESGDKS